MVMYMGMGREDCCWRNASASFEFYTQSVDRNIYNREIRMKKSGLIHYQVLQCLIT